MEPNEESEQTRVVVDSPGVRREVTTERTQTVPKEGPSAGVIALVAILAIGIIGVVIYVVTNTNANESANRNANIDVASQSQPPAALPQPASQAPIIIQQPAQTAPAPVIIQQPAAAAPENNSGNNEDLALQEAANKILLNDPDMGAVSIAVSGARAALTGTVNSQATKERAERLVKLVRGMKAVDNKIYVGV